MKPRAIAGMAIAGAITFLLFGAPEWLKLPRSTAAPVPAPLRGDHGAADAEPAPLLPDARASAAEDAKIIADDAARKTHQRALLIVATRELRTLAGTRVPELPADRLAHLSRVVCPTVYASMAELNLAPDEVENITLTADADLEFSAKACAAIRAAIAQRADEAERLAKAKAETDQLWAELLDVVKVQPMSAEQVDDAKTLCDRLVAYDTKYTSGEPCASVYHEVQAYSDWAKAAHYTNVINRGVPDAREDGDERSILCPRLRDAVLDMGYKTRIEADAAMSKALAHCKSIGARM